MDRLVGLAGSAMENSAIEILSEKSDYHPLQVLGGLGCNSCNFFDTFSSQVRQQVDGIACAKGCSYCCHIGVEVTVPELVYILTGFSSLKSDSQERILGNINAVYPLVEGLNALQRSKINVPCPLLDGDCCSVYAQRPLACRSWVSLDVSKCKAAYDAPADSLSAPVLPQLLETRAAIQEGTLRAMSRSGKQPLVLDLISALHLHFSSANAIERWYLNDDPELLNAGVTS